MRNTFETRSGVESSEYDPITLESVFEAIGRYKEAVQAKKALEPSMGQLCIRKDLDTHKYHLGYWGVSVLDHKTPVVVMVDMDSLPTMEAENIGRLLADVEDGEITSVRGGRLIYKPDSDDVYSGPGW